MREVVSAYYFDWLAHPTYDEYWRRLAPAERYEQIIWLKGLDNGVEQDQPVKLFVLGLDQWREEADWPLPDTQYRPYYLRSGGRANTAAGGDGQLSPQAPAEEEAADVYLYDPRRPVPTVGGAVLHSNPQGIDAGPRDQRGVEARADVLCYTTPPLKRPVEVTGPIELVLYAASSARDTDFTGKLVDVCPDGRAEILTDGILRARYRETFAEPQLLEPGQVYELRIDLWATANVCKAGHYIRLEVSRSNFPRFDRNTNTGGTIATESEADCVPAINRVYHDRAHLSHLLLPIIERARAGPREPGRERLLLPHPGIWTGLVVAGHRALLFPPFDFAQAAR